MTAYLGQILVRRKPHLEWVLSTQGGKRNLAYQKPVVSGFRNVPNKKYTAEYGLRVSMLGSRAVNNDLTDDSRRILLNLIHDDLDAA
jgi:hypothetical protein